MKAELKSLHSLELEDGLVNYWPSDASNFGTWIRAYVGPQGGRGAETFDIQVCTPDWLKSQCNAQGPLWGRHMLIVNTYDYNVIKAYVERYIANSEGEDWESIAVKLSRIGAWEFEDYQR